ncbi:MAG: tetratricopeptide repeat protein [Candidatus Odinarchaeota archaeon]
MTGAESTEEKYQKSLDLMKREQYEAAAAIASDLIGMQLSRDLLLECLVLAGNAYLKTGDYGNSQLSFNKIIGHAPNKAILSETLLGLGDLAWKTNKDLKIALNYYQEAFELKQELSLPLAEVHEHYADLYAAQGDFEQALEHQKQAVELRRKEGDTLELTKGLIELATIKANRDEFIETIEVLEEAEREAQKSEIAKELNLDLIALKNIATAYFYKGEIKTAYDIFNQAVKLKLDNVYPVRNPANLELLSDLVIYNTDMLNAEEALRFLNELKYFSEKSNDSLVQLTTEMTMAYYQKMFSPDSALVQLEKVLEVARVLNDAWITCIAQMSIAESVLFDYRNKHEDYEQALDMINETYKVAQKGFLVPLVLDCLIVLSYLDLIRNEQERAKERVLQASTLAAEKGLPGHEKRAREFYNFIIENAEAIDREYNENQREHENARTFDAIKSLKKASRFFSSIYRKAFY